MFLRRFSALATSVLSAKALADFAISPPLFGGDSKTGQTGRGIRSNISLLTAMIAFPAEQLPASHLSTSREVGNLGYPVARLPLSGVGSASGTRKADRPDFLLA